MKLMVISLLLIALPLVSALDFSFSSPEEINAEEEFTILISASLEGNYDVKAFVHAHTKQYSEIFYVTAVRTYKKGAGLHTYSP